MNHINEFDMYKESIKIDTIEYRLYDDHTAKVIGGQSTRHLVIPSSIVFDGDNYAVIEIGYAAFLDCTSLLALSIPESVRTIGGRAFCGCLNLQSVCLCEGLEYIGQDAFAFCSSLISVIIPSTVKTLSRAAFINCTNLTNLILPESINNVKPYVFYKCSNLRNVICHNNLKLDFYAFEGCPCLNQLQKE